MFGERDALVLSLSARRRRERRLRSFYRHEHMSIRMVVASMSHHSYEHSKSGVHATIQTALLFSIMCDGEDGSWPASIVSYFAATPAPALVIEYVAPAFAVTHAAPAPAIEDVAPAFAVTYTALSPVIDYVAPTFAVTPDEPAPVTEYLRSTSAIH